MNENEAELKNNINTHEILRLAICSDLRKNLLITLNEGGKSLGSLRDGLNISSTTALHALKDLEKKNLIFKDKDKNYALTNIGRITALKIMDFSNAAEVLNKHERFWLEHDLGGIPDHLLEKLGWLRESFVEKAPSTDIFKVYSTFIELLKNATEIRGASSIFVPVYNDLFKDIILNKKIDTKLIVTADVLNKIDKEVLKEIYNNNLRFELYLIKYNIKAGLMVTDSALSFGLFNYNDTYDWNNDLISFDKKAILWGYELFDFYCNKSQRIFL